MGFPILVRWQLYIESGPRSRCADLLALSRYFAQPKLWYGAYAIWQFHRNRKFVRVAVLVFTGDVEGCLQCLQWRPEQAPMTFPFQWLCHFYLEWFQIAWLRWLEVGWSIHLMWGSCHKYQYELYHFKCAWDILWFYYSGCISIYPPLSPVKMKAILWLCGIGKSLIKF